MLYKKIKEWATAGRRHGKARTTGLSGGIKMLKARAGFGVEKGGRSPWEFTSAGKRQEAEPKRLDLEERGRGF